MQMKLEEIQELLNTDESFQNQFMEDPIATLKSKGVNLDGEAQEELIGLVRSLRDGEKSVPGSITIPDAKGVGVGISISKDF